jgi:uncharacterized protein (DUF362 family)
MTVQNAIRICKEHSYPLDAPFHPSTKYPEYLFNEISVAPNNVYDTIRNLFIDLKYDHDNIGKSEWNPLGSFIKSGNKVVIKPNWVRHFNPIENHINGLVTHTSIIRTVIDYCIIALKGKGTIIIGDAPIQSCDFKMLCERNSIIHTINSISPLTSVKLEVKDFRKEIMISKYGMYNRIENENNEIVKVNLGKESFLYEISGEYKKFRVSGYNKEMLFKYHNNQDHIYLIAKDVLNADVIIEIPKLKTHRKAGMTCCLKNNVGINALKDCLVHHRKGSKEEGGDAYLKKSITNRLKEYIGDKYDNANYPVEQFFLRRTLKIYNMCLGTSNRQKRVDGSWYGNDTLWRMIIDISRIVLYADLNGIMHNKPERKVLYLIDAIKSGEGEGPLEPKSVNTGIIGFGNDPLLLDVCMASLVGFDFTKIPSIVKVLENKIFGYDTKGLLSRRFYLNNHLYTLNEIKTAVYLKSSYGWINHIEK